MVAGLGETSPRPSSKQLAPPTLGKTQDLGSQSVGACASVCKGIWGSSPHFMDESTEAERAAACLKPCSELMAEGVLRLGDKVQK